MLMIRFQLYQKKTKNNQDLSLYARVYVHENRIFKSNSYLVCRHHTKVKYNTYFQLIFCSFFFLVYFLIIQRLRYVLLGDRDKKKLVFTGRFYHIECQRRIRCEYFHQKRITKKICFSDKLDTNSQRFYELNI